MDARDAVGVLFDREVLKLVAVVLVGWWLVETSTVATGWVGFPGPLQLLYEWLVALARLTGYAVYYGGVLALLTKLVFEAAVRAESR